MAGGVFLPREGVRVLAELLLALLGLGDRLVALRLSGGVLGTRPAFCVCCLDCAIFPTLPVMSASAASYAGIAARATLARLFVPPSRLRKIAWKLDLITLPVPVCL